ncbi:hypothetical protein GIB67_027711 [Kingdonia uniflora]|uniref:FAS1 domain-containing protein n=1 Tax=Kingdonia uniflora TaxID=39325 RepID=A0A7J7NLG1_9MAGN|nr:hypothetical protein GIB67_027711 [Kingdonia uniflora]
MKTSLFSFTLLLTLQYSLAQPPAQSPAPSGPTNITGILEKAGQFNTFLRLLKSTQEVDQINTQLNNSNQGVTLFAPPDNAFATLKSGTLNFLTDQQKVELVQFHVLPSFISIAQFQTVSNPLRTQAGNANNGQFPLNVTTSGTQVNVTTGVVDTTVANIIYTDGNLAIYQVNKVLLPLEIFGDPAPANAPKPQKGSSTRSSADSPSDDSSDDTSSATGLIKQAASFVVLAAIGIFYL